MGEFARATITFPTLLFTVGVVVMVGYWLAVIAGLVQPNLGGPKRDSVLSNKFADIPPAVTVTSLLAQGWFWALLLDANPAPEQGLVRLAVRGVVFAVLGLVLAYFGTRLLAYILRRTGAVS
ncbi:MAG: hypothetical protein J2P18_02005 [Nocardia sp.]|nr:hypothetical protein [Nocardia sp.]